MKSTLIPLILVGTQLWAGAAPSPQTIENDAIAWHWQVVDGKVKPLSVTDKLNGRKLALDGEFFKVVLEDGTVLKSSDFESGGEPTVRVLEPRVHLPVAAEHSSGKQLIVPLTNSKGHLSAVWRVMLRDGSTYVRQELMLSASGSDVPIKEIVLFEQTVPGATVAGSVDGSPVVAGDFFLGYEHPMAQNSVSAGGVVRCGFLRNALLKNGESLKQSLVLGASPAGQMRRGFLAYIERERAHPYRPFLHYNSWFDIAWDKRKFNEEESLDAMGYFARELVEKRGVAMKSFLFDDGWDDNRTLWKFHSGFPNGFEGVEAAARKLNASVGVWLSPFGGYDLARQLRIEYGVEQGFETNASGFSLAGPKYYERFHDICLSMVENYDVNMFKFDGLAAGAKASETGQTRDGDAMMRLIADLRAAKPDIYINETTGTWPSPFWLLYVDSTWRAGADHQFTGKGSARQQWITYRDAQTYQNVVLRGPLYPLNSLMLHGVIYAKNASKLQSTDDADFTDEVNSFFASGTQLQELYLTPKLLNQRNWDDIARAAKWSQANADVMVDTHWVGGDPGKDQIYGWASWTPQKAILALRNPDDKTATFDVDARVVFQIPAGVSGTIKLVRVLGDGKVSSPVELAPGKPHSITLQPFEVVVLESRADSSLSQSARLKDSVAEARELH